MEKQMYTKSGKKDIGVKKNFAFCNIKRLKRIQNKQSLSLIPLI